MKKLNISKVFGFHKLQKSFFSPRAKTSIAKLPSVHKELIHVNINSKEPILTGNNKFESIKNFNSYELDLNRSDLINEFYFLNENKLITSKIYEGEDESEQTTNSHIEKEKKKYLKILHLFNKWKESKEREGKSIHDLSAEDMPEELKLLFNQEEIELKNSGVVFEDDTEELVEDNSASIKARVEDLKIPSEEFSYFEKYLDLKNRKMLITENKLREIENIKPKRLVKHNALNGRTYIYETPQDALEELKTYAEIKDYEEDEKLKLEIVVNLDLERPDHYINGFCNMPGGLGETPNICVITTDDNKDICYDAGAFIVMHSEQLDNLSKLDDPLIEFKRIVCTKDELETIGKYKEFLDRYNLHMPNEKNGTCVTSTEDLVKIINTLKSSTVLFETENRLAQGHDNSKFKETIINVDIGNLSLTDVNIFRNVDSAMQTLSRLQPQSVMGRYFLSASLHIGDKSFRINIKSMDPSERGYFAKNKNIKNLLFK